MIDAVLDSGIIQSKVYHGGVDSVYSTCSLSDLERKDDNHPWMKHFDRVAFEKKLLSQCVDRSECVPEFKLSDFTNGEIEQEPGLVLFAQVSCKQTEETLLRKNLVGMFVACIGLSMVAHFHFRISKLKGHCLIN